MKSLFNHFEVLEDPRDIRGKKHELINIIIMTIYGILCGYNDFTNLADFLKVHEDYFNELLQLENGTPSHDTLSNVFKVIDSKKFMELFIEWIKDIVKDKGMHLSIDGKAIKSARDKVNGGNTPYIVSAFLSDIGLSIGQLKVDDKSNEITAIPELLKILDIDGCIITIDAIGTQTEIMDKIIQKGGNFVLPVKMNNKGANKDTIDFFNDSIEKDFNAKVKSKKKVDNIEYINSYKEKFEVYVTRENTHGREEERVYIKSNNISWLKDKKWKHIKCVIMAINNTTVHDNSIRYYFSSVDLPIEELAKIIRKHWQIENNLHWVLDMYFYEDLSRNRKDNAMENLSILKKLCYNIIKMDKRYDRVNKNGNLVKLSTKRKMNRYIDYPEEFEELLTTVIPQIYKM